MNALASSGAIIPKSRYEQFLQTYQGTDAAYMANLKLAKEDYKSLRSSTSGAFSRQNASKEAEAFVSKYAFGPYARPSKPNVAEIYDAELHPMIVEAIRETSSPDIALKYVFSFPNSRYTPAITQEIESTILDLTNPENSVRLFHVYETNLPDHHRTLAFRSRFEMAMFMKVSKSRRIDQFNLFLNEFPQSVHAAQVKELIDSAQSEQVSASTDGAELRRIIKKDPNAPAAQKARVALERLEAEDRAFYQAMNSNSIRSLREYLATGPPSRYVAQTEEKLEELKFDSLPEGTKAELSEFRRTIASHVVREDRALTALDGEIRQLRISLRDEDDSIKSLELKRDGFAAKAAEERRIAKSYADQIDTFYARIRPNGTITGEIESSQKQFEFHSKEAERFENESTRASDQIAEHEAAKTDIEKQIEAKVAEADELRESKRLKTQGLEQEYASRLQEAFRQANIE